MLSSGVVCGGGRGGGWDCTLSYDPCSHHFSQFWTVESFQKSVSPPSIESLLFYYVLAFLHLLRNPTPLHLGVNFVWRPDFGRGNREKATICRTSIPSASRFHQFHFCFLVVLISSHNSNFRTGIHLHPWSTHTLRTYSPLWSFLKPFWYWEI